MNSRIPTSCTDRLGQEFFVGSYGVTCRNDSFALVRVDYFTEKMVRVIKLETATGRKGHWFLIYAKDFLLVDEQLVTMYMLKRPNK